MTTAAIQQGIGQGAIDATWVVVKFVEALGQTPETKELAKGLEAKQVLFDASSIELDKLEKQIIEKCIVN